MTERLAQLMHAEADTWEVPPPPVAEILVAGRRQRRRHRLVPVLGSVAAAAAVGALTFAPGLWSDVEPTDGSAAVHQRSDASFSSAEAGAARAAYTRDGAFALGSRVFLGDGEHSVEMGDPAVRGLYYTSAGVLVRHGKDYVMDGSSREGYSLVGTDGSVTGIDLELSDVSPSTEPTQPYLVHARPGEGEGDWDVMVLDLRTGKVAATVPVNGSFTWGGWDAPPVALSGDRVYVGLDDAMLAVDWRTGEVIKTPLPSSTYPDVNADRYLHIEDSKSGMSGGTIQVRDALSGESLIELPFEGQRGASLSPDGKHVLVSPYMTVTEDGQIQRLSGAVLHSVDTGQQLDVPSSPTGGYGWTPAGLLFSVHEEEAMHCDVGAGRCSRSSLELADEDTGTIRLGGMVNEA